MREEIPGLAEGARYLMVTDGQMTQTPGRISGTWAGPMCWSSRNWRAEEDDDLTVQPVAQSAGKRRRGTWKRQYTSASRGEDYESYAMICVKCSESQPTMVERGLYIPSRMAGIEKSRGRRQELDVPTSRRK
jgi:hypothetical protein